MTSAIKKLTNVNKCEKCDVRKLWISLCSVYCEHLETCFVYI